MPVAAAEGDLSAAIREPRLKRFYDYWQMARRGRRFPARCDIDPLDFPYMLGNVMLVDVLRDPLRFRVRLHGTEMVARSQYDLTGKLLDDLPISEFRDLAVGRCRQMVEDPRPRWVQQQRVLDGRIHHYQALWLPLSADGATVTMLMCGLIYDPDTEPQPPS